MKIKKLAGAAILSALSIVLMLAVRIRMPAPINFLEYDLADIPILIGTFAYGPIVGLAMTVVVSVLQGVLVSSDSLLYGVIMHVLATGSFVLMAGNLYKKRRTRKGAAISLGFGSLTQVIVMFFANLFITPVYLTVKFMMPATVASDTVWSLMPLIMLFNVGRVVVNSGITFITYKGVRHILPK